MISRTSLFNKGIFYSTLKRYMWGSVLYSIILFALTSLIILLGVDVENSWYRMSDRRVALILGDHYLILPVIIGLFVPTVVALLTFRFLHSKKTAIFVHSLPVTRTANYISTVLAAFVLMGAPVVLNGVILAFLSIFKYGEFFTVTSCLIWTGLNLLTLFSMFSIAAFAAGLTGNSFAAVGLNGLIHGIVLIFAAAFSAIAKCFLYGYHDLNRLLYGAMRWNFVSYLTETASAMSIKNAPGFDFLKIGTIILISLMFYVFGWLIYRKRRMETAEDVAAFRCLNPIYKYLLSFISALSTFGILSGAIAEKPLVPVIFTIIVSLVVYFAAEMVLKKSFKVWKAYKGYLVFVAAFSVMICIFAFTSFFGFETRIPSRSDFDEVAIYEYYYQDDMPWISDEEIIDYTTAVHKMLTKKENIYTVKRDDGKYTTAINIRYKLKNGKTMVRRYPVTEVMACEILENLYKHEIYKKKIFEVFGEQVGEVYRITVNEGNIELADKEKIEEFFECLSRDILELDYTQMCDSNAWRTSVMIEYIRTEDLMDDDKRHMWNIHQSINANFKHTLGWLIANGYQKPLFNAGNWDLCILNREQWEKYREIEEVTMASHKGPMVEVARLPQIQELSDIGIISDDLRKNKIDDFVIFRGVRFVPEKDYSYYVCGIDNGGYLNVLAAFYEDGEDLLNLID
ncbi:MAG: ABC transporter permease [Clostridia bacterium]|nr:ABC transporter permease [Clostridia bacterium]